MSWGEHWLWHLSEEWAGNNGLPTNIGIASVELHLSADFLFVFACRIRSHALQDGRDHLMVNGAMEKALIAAGGNLAVAAPASRANTLAARSRRVAGCQRSGRLAGPYGCRAAAGVAALLILQAPFASVAVMLRLHRGARQPLRFHCITLSMVSPL